MRSLFLTLQACGFFLLCLLAAFMFAAEGSAPSAFRKAAPAGHFVDATAKLGIHFRQQASPTSKKYLLETMGSGVAVFDYDNDGRLDIFLANGAPLTDPTPKGTIPKKAGPQYWNRLYHQKSDGTSKTSRSAPGLREAGIPPASQWATTTMMATKIYMSLAMATPPCITTTATAHLRM